MLVRRCSDAKRAHRDGRARRDRFGRRRVERDPRFRPRTAARVMPELAAKASMRARWRVGAAVGGAPRRNRCCIGVAAAECRRDLVKTVVRSPSTLKIRPLPAEWHCAFLAALSSMSATKGGRAPQARQLYEALRGGECRPASLSGTPDAGRGAGDPDRAISSSNGRPRAGPRPYAPP